MIDLKSTAGDFAPQFQAVFGKTATHTARVPYSVLLAGDGADLSVATDMDGLFLVAENPDGEIHFTASGYNGVFTTDSKLTGPYANESETAAGVVRGVKMAFEHFGYKTCGLDILANCPTVPGADLDEPSHLAICLCFIMNNMANAGMLSEKRLAECAQWTLANYMLLDSYATDTYSSIQGRSLRGNFENPEKPEIKPIDVNMSGCGLYTVDIKDTGVDLTEDEVESRLDALIDFMGVEPEEMDEKAFYKFLQKNGDDLDLPAVLYLMDYYTQENFEQIYSANGADGAGSPSVGQSLEFKAEKSGIAGITPKTASWCQLCCVTDSARADFICAMETIFGKECVVGLQCATAPASWTRI